MAYNSSHYRGVSIPNGLTYNQMFDWVKAIDDYYTTNSCYNELCYTKSINNYTYCFPTYGINELAVTPIKEQSKPKENIKELIAYYYKRR